MTKVCFTCRNTDNAFEIHKINLVGTDDWTMLQNKISFFSNGLDIDKSKLKTKKSRGSNFKVKVHLGGPGRHVFYYAAQPKKDPLLKFTAPGKAYDKLQNSGLSKIDKDGNIIFHLKCPQNYLEKGMWYPHVHFVISNSSCTKWMPHLYTRLVLCPVDKTFIKHAIQTDKYMVFNALPMEEYIKDHIPSSFPLPYNTLGKLNDNQIIHYIKEMSIHHRSISNYVYKNKENIFHIPIVVYCYNKKCDASIKLIQRLWKIGFRNVKEYEGGITDWNK